MGAAGTSWIVVPAPFGAARLEARSGRLVRLSLFRDPGAAAAGVSGRPASRPAPAPLEAAAEQLAAYFAARRREFDLPVDPGGTPFQRRVWSALMEIPWGATRSYGEIARAIGRPGAARAVGAACGANPIAIVIPCHRAIGSDGALTGFAAGVDVKRFLLDLEQRGRKLF